MAQPGHTSKNNPVGNTRGEAHPRYKSGCYINEHGYVRLMTGRVSAQYEHRAVIEHLMLEQAVLKVLDTCSKRKAADAITVLITNPPRIPAHMTVHHQNSDRTHNCPCNLMLLDKVIHYAITASHRKYVKRMEEQQMMERLRNAGA